MFRLDGPPGQGVGTVSGVHESPEVRGEASSLATAGAVEGSVRGGR